MRLNWTTDCRYQWLCTTIYPFQIKENKNIPCIPHSFEAKLRIHFAWLSIPISPFSKCPRPGPLYNRFLSSSDSNHGIIRDTNWLGRERDKYSARRRGLTEVPVRQGRAAVVTTQILLVGWDRSDSGRISLDCSQSIASTFPSFCISWETLLSSFVARDSKLEPSPEPGFVTEEHKGLTFNEDALLLAFAAKACSSLSMIGSAMTSFPIMLFWLRTMKIRLLLYHERWLE